MPTITDDNNDIESREHKKRRQEEGGEVSEIREKVESGQKNEHKLNTRILLDTDGETRLFGYVPFKTVDGREAVMVELAPGLPQSGRPERVLKTLHRIDRVEKSAQPQIREETPPEERTAVNQLANEQTLEQRIALIFLNAQAEHPGSLRQIKGDLPNAIQNRYKYKALNVGLRLLTTYQVAEYLKERLKGCGFSMSDVEGTEGKVIHCSMTPEGIGIRGRNPDSEHILLVIGERDDDEKKEDVEEGDDEQELLVGFSHYLKNNSRKVAEEVNKLSNQGSEAVNEARKKFETAGESENYLSLSVESVNNLMLTITEAIRELLSSGVIEKETKGKTENDESDQEETISESVQNVITVANDDSLKSEFLNMGSIVEEIENSKLAQTSGYKELRQATSEIIEKLSRWIFKD